MYKITLKHLRYFDALATELHFGKAAKLCNISQPALSMQIKELEEILNCSLVEREAKNLELTPQGKLLSAKAKNILSDILDLEEMAFQFSKDWQGALRLGIIPTIAPYMLPHLLPLITDYFPDSTLQIRETMTEKIIDELHKRALDAAILALPIDDDLLDEFFILEEEFCLIAPKNQIDPIPMHIDHLPTSRLLLLEEGHCFRDQALSFCKIREKTPQEILDATNLSTLVQLVNSGVGITLLPSMAVESETKNLNITCHHFSDPKPSRKIGMVWRKNHPMTQHLQRLHENITQTFNSLTNGINVKP